jgi:hypothetical protein
MEYSKLDKNLEIKYLNNMIKYGLKNNRDINFIKDQCEILEKKNEIFLQQSDSDLANIITDVKMVTYSDDYLYQKTWTKVSQIHKIIKIKEFVSKLLINKEEDKEKLIQQLSDLVRKKVLTKKTTVNYDSIKGRIISIPNLKYEKNNYYYKY